LFAFAWAGVDFDELREIAAVKKLRSDGRFTGLEPIGGKASGSCFRFNADFSHYRRSTLGVEFERSRAVEAKLRFKYDREADILHIDKCPPYAEQESEELPDEIVARLNPNTGEVENLEVLFFTTRLLRADLFELPVTADLRLVGTGG
jgi:uncharacterized protein YuzE